MLLFKNIDATAAVVKLDDADERNRARFDVDCIVVGRERTADAGDWRPSRTSKRRLRSIAATTAGEFAVFADRCVGLNAKL